jgi:hypothetical protein
MSRSFHQYSYLSRSAACKRAKKCCEFWGYGYDSSVNSKSNRFTKVIVYIKDIIYDSTSVILAFFIKYCNPYVLLVVK